MYLRFLLISLFCFLNLSFLTAQAPRTMHAGELKLALKKLNTLGSALYIAAHPDDENTALLAWLNNERLLRTAYLSLTRGDGGQNLIGPEQRELMGLIRTQELMQARKIDGAEQFFTRANDFGFSKSAEETFEIFNKDKILADMVWAIRKFKPDVIITRFPPTKDAGHGHHEASAILAEEAFKAAANPKMFSEQLKYVQVWQAKRLVWNSYNRRFQNQAPENASYVSAKISSYNPLLGKLHTIIAAESRSMHKSQGFGATKTRNERIDYLTHTAGEQAQNDLLDGINLSWTRIKGTDEISSLLKEAYQKFNAENPTSIVPLLIKTAKLLEELQANESDINYWKEVKKKELENVLVNCLGLWYEVNGREFAVSNGESTKIRLEVVKQSDYPVSLQKIKVLNRIKETATEIYSLDDLNLKLANTILFDSTVTVSLDAKNYTTQAYWLNENPQKGYFVVNDQRLIGLPENTAPLAAVFTFEIEGRIFNFERPVTYKWTKPEEGELYRYFEITPEVMVNLDDKVYIFSGNEAKEINLSIKAGKHEVEGELQIEVPKNWKIEPQNIPFKLQNKDQEKRLVFRIFPPAKPEEGFLKINIKTKDSAEKQTARGLFRINYPHIPILTLFPKAEAKLVRLDIQTKGKKIGYIDGAGDEIPQYLQQIGYEVVMLKEKELQEDITKYDAIIVGVRAYNTEERLKHHQAKLMEYVKNGGVVVTQYQTNFRMVTPEIGPFPFKIGRERVTLEEAPVKFLIPEHPILNSPNKITEKDFEAWIQERGLYFAGEWDKQYQTVLSSNDPNEKAQEGGLLYANYGKGRFIYTGYAFFREIPAGVSGAYRLFVNLISR